MNTKRFRYDEIDSQRNFIWFRKNEILTQRKYVLLLYINYGSKEEFHEFKL